ncbi:MAG: protein arginine N-methyltransferase [Byssovorax sp.]
MTVSIEALCEMGLAAYEAGAFDEAIVCFGHAAQRDPACVPAWTNLASALLSSGDAESAAGALAKAIALAPESAEIRYNLGAALRRAGDPAGAVDAYAGAIALGMDTHEAFNNLGLALADDGRFDDAISAYARALDHRRDPAILVNLGNALGETAEHNAAVRCYEAALAIDADSAAAMVNLFAARFDDGDLGPSEALLDRALTVAPDHASALFHRGVIAGLRAGRVAAEPYFARLPAGLGHLVSSFDYALEKRAPGTRFFANGFRLLDHALAASTVDGLTIELGVRRGASIRFLASRAPDRTWHGFDSFEGLPEAWRGVGAGAYSTRGELPGVPENVRLYPGWFADTLPAFTAEHPGPVRFLNVDCDIHASARDALAVLGPRLVRGSVIVFDEYFCNPGWEEDEHHALVEAAASLGLSYTFIAVSFFSKQAAIVVR